MIEILQRIFSDHCGLKLELNNRSLKTSKALQIKHEKLELIFN